MAWVISDTHFGHFNAIRHENRPFTTTEEMNEHMIEKWNSVVRPSDIIYHVGDFAFRCGLNTMQDIFNRLNGRKVLIRGNHEEKPSKYYMMGWEQVFDSLRLNWDGVEFTISHYPLGHEGGLHDYGQFHIHGHTHSKTPQKNGRQFNVGAEHANYTPIKLTDITRYFKGIKNAETISDRLIIQ